MQSFVQLKRILLKQDNSFLMYLVVGSLTAVTYISLFMLLTKIMHGSYQKAVSIAYIVSVSFHFFANRKFTFKKKTNLLVHQLPRYLLFLVFNYVLTLIAMYITVDSFHLSPCIGLVLTIAATCMLSYVISKFWIFQAV